MMFIIENNYVTTEKISRFMFFFQESHSRRLI